MERELPMPCTPSLDRGTPSTTIRGSLEALSDEPPRIRIVPEPSGPPEVVTTTPGVCPTSISCTEVASPASISSGLTTATEPVASLFFTVP